MRQKARERSEEGFWKAYDHLRNEGKPWNHKMVHRIYKALGLSLRRKTKKRLPRKDQGAPRGAQRTEPHLEHGLCNRCPGKQETLQVVQRHR